MTDLNPNSGTDTGLPKRSKGAHKMAGDREMDAFALLLPTLGSNSLRALADKAARMAEGGEAVETLQEFAARLRDLAASREVASAQTAQAPIPSR